VVLLLIETDPHRLGCGDGRILRPYQQELK